METTTLDTIKSALVQMGKQDNLFDALYRRIAAVFGISSCELWVFYYLSMNEDGMTQQQMIEVMMFPKQTINSAVSALAKNGMVALESGAENRKNKIVRLTKKGCDFAQNSVARLLNAEIRATEKFGEEKTCAYNALRAEYFSLLKTEFEGDFLKSE